MTIKAIPATYKGIQYRSRTEARWAVFFELLKIDYDYEREGYTTRLGWYVPDFWLPNCQCWVEIKGTEHDHNEHIEKLREVCYATQSYGFVFVGPPKEMRGSFVGDDFTDSSGGAYGGEFDAGIIRVDNGYVNFAIDSGRRDREFFGADTPRELANVTQGDFHKLQSRQITDAAATASKHRFW